MPRDENIYIVDGHQVRPSEYPDLRKLSEQLEQEQAMFMVQTSAHVIVDGDSPFDEPDEAPDDTCP